MQNRAYAVILAAAVALMAASGASAKTTAVHANVKQARHMLVKPAHKANHRSIDRRAARGNF